MQPQVQAGTGNKVMSKKQRKEQSKQMAKQAEAISIAERDRDWAREIATHFAIRRAFGNACFS
jgi:hypothetical protein